MQFDNLLHEIQTELLQEKNIEVKMPFVLIYDVFIPEYPVKNLFSITKTKQIEDGDPLFKIRLDKDFENKKPHEQKNILKQIISLTLEAP